MTKSQPITKQMVWEAYHEVKRNKGTAGIDQMSLEALDLDLSNQLYKLWNRMSSGSYYPPPVKRVEIPKGDGGIRPLGIPTVLDRIAQTVVKRYLEPSLEEVFSENSYGYRPGRSAHEALEAARQHCWKYDWVLDIDIKGFFDAIDHGKLEKALKKHCKEKWVQIYVGRWLRAQVQHPNGEREERTKGTPQGGVVSPLLANLYLHYAFDEWLRRERRNQAFERYADDIIVHCQSEAEAEELLERIRQRMRDCGLELHPEKTKIVYCRDDRRTRPTNRPKKFSFLGYDFKPRKQWNKAKRRAFTGFDLGISSKAKKRIRKYLSLGQKLWKKIPSIELIAGELNARISGWMNYYGRFGLRPMRVLLVELNYRLVKWAKQNYKRLGRSNRRAQKWLVRQYQTQPKLFAHWQKGFMPYT